LPPVSGQAPEPTLAITRPTADVVVRGQTMLEATVVPEATRVRSVAFFVDGQQVCRVEARPFECSWDAGSQPDARTFRVVAQLADGGLLRATVRTKPPDGTQPIFTTAVDAVLVPVQVRDDHGRFVPGLTASNFALTEDGRPQTVGIAFGDAAPISVLLALDVSGSMQPRLNDLKKAAAIFLDSVRSQDVVSLTAFNSTLYMLARPGATPRARIEALERLKPEGGTALHDSLIRAVDLVKNQPSPRVIVAFTDGQDVGSISTVAAVRIALQVNNVTLFLVVQGGVPQRGSPIEALSRAAEETGGGAWFALGMGFLKDRFAQVISDMSSRYVLSYVPERPFGDGGWRALSVKIVGGPLRERDYELKAKKGYLALTAEQSRGQ
jgi:VWFA-related protein